MFENVNPDMVVVVAGMILAVGFVITNQLILRGFVVVGQVLYITYYAIVSDTPLWSAIIIATAQLLAALIGLCLLLVARSYFIIPRQHRDIYDRFSQLPPGDFRALITKAKRYQLDADTTITTEGHHVDKLYFILSGEVSADKLGSTFSLPAGIFVGEVAYLTRSTASGTTHVTKGAELLEWDVATLRRRSEKNPQFKMALDSLISGDLAVKVAAAIAPGAYRST